MVGGFTFSACGVKFVTVEGMQKVTFAKDDNGVENGVSVPHSLSYISDPQQCSVCYTHLCGHIHLSDNGQFEDCHHWNSI